MQIETRRLVLRGIREDDYDAIHAYGSDPVVTRYTSFGPNTEEQTRAFIRSQIEAAREEPRQHYNLLTVRRADGAVLGAVGIGLTGRQDGEAEAGWVLRQDAWGCGYATEMARAIIDHGFKIMDLHRIIARCHVANQASARVMRKCGMRHEGRLLECAFIKGTWWDMDLYAILRREWTEQGLTDGPLRSHNG